MNLAKFTIVTATAGQSRANECFSSWHARRALDGCGGVIVGQRLKFVLEPEFADSVITLSVPDYLGPVPAFRLGLDLALQITAPDGIIALIHDDVLIEEDGWDQSVLDFFTHRPQCGLLGFGGGTGLGSDDIYQAPYNPMQLARQDFVSNMRDAEAHGRRVLAPVRVACLDGFSQVGRVAYWKGYPPQFPPPLHQLEDAGVIHHAFDSALGALACRNGWEVWMLPIAVHHFGGMTAVADADYNLWALQQRPGDLNFATGKVAAGDQAFWESSHRICYEMLRGVLPLRF